jgi:hypothetical protein
LIGPAPDSIRISCGQQGRQCGCSWRWMRGRLDGGVNLAVLCPRPSLQAICCVAGRPASTRSSACPVCQGRCRRSSLVMGNRADARTCFALWSSVWESGCDREVACSRLISVVFGCTCVRSGSWDHSFVRDVSRHRPVAVGRSSSLLRLSWRWLPSSWHGRQRASGRMHGVIEWQNAGSPTRGGCGWRTVGSSAGGVEPTERRPKSPVRSFQGSTAELPSPRHFTKSATQGGWRQGHEWGRMSRFRRKR